MRLETNRRLTNNALWKSQHRAPRARRLAHLRAWLAADGHGGDVYFFAATGGLAHLKAWLAADAHGNEGGCNGEYLVGRRGKRKGMSPGMQLESNEKKAIYQFLSMLL